MRVPVCGHDRQGEAATLDFLLFASAGILATGQSRDTPIDTGVADATPPISRPAGRRCIVSLFERQEFQGEASLPLAYRPPADCPGPWRKILLEADFDTTTGHQFDRTADLTLGGATLFVGTTMEPDVSYAPRWHVERDVTDFAALLTQPRTGMATLANYLDQDHTGRLFWGARLVFYPGDTLPANRIVLPVTNGLTRLDTRQPLTTRTLTLPRNLTRLTLDLFAIGQERDEFWYDCVPPAFAQPSIFASASCGAPYREVEVRIDRHLAGLRAVSPILFTGGINPNLWRRAPGLHALNLPSAQLDLTPFAGMLNDGKPHAITLAMPDVNSSFRVSATLIGEVDPSLPVVSGRITENTLTPARVVTRQIRQGSRRDLSGTLRTTARRSGHIQGYVETSYGRVTTRVAYDLDMRLTAVRDLGPSGKRYAAHQVMRVSTHGALPTDRRIEERDTLTIAMNIDPPRHGVRYGTQIDQGSERILSGYADRDATITQSLTSFAPAFSVFAAPRSTPNRVTVRTIIHDAVGNCRRIEAIVTDDDITRADNVGCTDPVPADK